MFVIDAKDYLGKAGGVCPSSVALNHGQQTGDRLFYMVIAERLYYMH